MPASSAARRDLASGRTPKPKITARGAAARGGGGGDAVVLFVPPPPGVHDGVAPALTADLADPLPNRLLGTLGVGLDDDAQLGLLVAAQLVEQALKGAG